MNANRVLTTARVGSVRAVLLTLALSALAACASTSRRHPTQQPMTTPPLATVEAPESRPSTVSAEPATPNQPVSPECREWYDATAEESAPLRRAIYALQWPRCPQAAAAYESIGFSDELRCWYGRSPFPAARARYERDWVDFRRSPSRLEILRVSDESALLLEHGIALDVYSVVFPHMHVGVSDYERILELRYDGTEVELVSETDRRNLGCLADADRILVTRHPVSAETSQCRIGQHECHQDCERSYRRWRRRCRSSRYPDTCIMGTEARSNRCRLRCDCTLTRCLDRPDLSQEFGTACRNAD